MPNRNVENRLASNPAVEISRSRIDRSFSVKTSFNVGDVIPIYCEEVLPGDTFNVKTNSLVRMQTLITPVMDNMYLDTYFFFVPNRLVWNHWKEFNGENTASAWIPQAEYTIPQITAPVGGWNVGTIADYLGLPTGVSNISVSALPFRAYALIMNEWFRDENLTDPLNIPVNDSTQTGSNGGSYVNDVANGGLPFKASKYFDVFTAALPAPQKGPDIMLNMVDGFAPVIPMKDQVPQSSLKYDDPHAHVLGWISPYTFLSPKRTTDDYYLNQLRAPNIYDTDQNGIFGVYGAYSLSSYPAASGSDAVNLIPANLWADNSSLPGISINQFRLAFQIQKFYERQARGGSRYVEVIKSFFGVTSPDYRLQRPEYLGGKRQPINVNAVTQTSATASGSTAQGNQAAYSVTHSSHDDFVKSFTEHGYILGFAVVRYDHSYQQGIERHWSRKTKFDYYWPVFANLGEQAILNKEIFAQGSSVTDTDGNVVDDQVFGYQEAWYDYRYKFNRITGEMRSQYNASLDVWHLGDDYSQLPMLSDSWIREDKANVDRVLSVTSAVSNQFFGDFYFQNWVTRPLPLYSIPGLVDHH